jgi:16S rRNA (uracil1498-N3)-methyltransferase
VARGPGPAASPGPLVFVADLERPDVDDADRHHLERVIRLRTGDAFVAADGVGGWRPCRFGSSVEPDGPIARVARPEPPITIAFAVPKGDRPELVVQKLTELGVDAIIPMTTDRSVVRWDGSRAARHVERLRVTARAAAMQSKRPWLPTVADLAVFADAAAQPGACLAEPGGSAPALDRPVVLVGPEGGWSPGERDAGLPAVDLGDGILRAETAAIVAGALLAALRAGVVSQR